MKLPTRRSTVNGTKGQVIETMVSVRDIGICELICGYFA